MLNLMVKFDVIGILISFCLISLLVVAALICGTLVIIVAVSMIRSLIDFIFKKGDGDK